MSISLSSRRLDPAERRGPLVARWRWALRRARLDRRLLAGDDPRADSALRLRAAELRSPRVRRALATNLEGLLEAAERPQPSCAVVKVDRCAVRLCRRWLLRLAADLRESGEVDPRGVLLVRRLLTDGASPVYGAPNPEALALALRHARAALLLTRP